MGLLEKFVNEGRSIDKLQNTLMDFQMLNANLGVAAKRGKYYKGLCRVVKNAYIEHYSVYSAELQHALVKTMYAAWKENFDAYLDRWAATPVPEVLFRNRINSYRRS